MSSSNLTILGLLNLLGYVPYVASRSILLKKLDFTGRLWEVRIFFNYNGLEDK